MAAELSPEEALRIATDARRAAAPPRVPGWFPYYAGATFVLSMAAVGASDLVGRNPTAASALGITGIVLFVAHFAMYGELMRRWRRGGLVPLSDTCATRARRRASGWFLLVALAVGGACLLAGSTGWAMISFGLVVGVETTYRLIGWTRPE